ncbi:hypothetical protein TCAL_02108 [Tigriopus californicus]|uniref:Bcl-2 Bcl-2 homology region 1-3 domain-containing protein n=1 Tax=Tigriopus californicus TaxID=6832 RepID=A0A553N9U5_TIGCA|nr:uncharacterized protein LOC131885417 [Tigriopus californicus]TRY62165.1 hypothetical protein TCAL_02108 [Tigriopus californicus]|eukprot:TCALIF_02108-PA protein Name:"Similar to BCL2 Apoptosis regulator Bcl-2 (Gallus gallus)" AED:0.05 eAED:0.05 QI:296/1/1/1/0.75/0.6/5/81/405
MARKFPCPPVEEDEAACTREREPTNTPPTSTSAARRTTGSSTPEWHEEEWDTVHTGQTPHSSFSSHGSSSSGPARMAHLGPTDMEGGFERPVPPPGNHGGAVPRRSASFRQAAALELSRRAALNARRRRLDSLNLDESVVSGSEGWRSGLLEHVTEWWPTSGALLAGLTGLEGQGSCPVQEIEAEGSELYLHFFHEQMRRAGLEARPLEESEGLMDYHDHSAHMDASDGGWGSPSSPPSPFSVRSSNRRRNDSFNLGNFQNPAWRQAGRDLQLLADEFCRSRERDQVRWRAEQVDIRSLTMNKFMALLNELFEGGQITRERILVLFFFCSDVSILAVKHHLSGILSQLTKWTLAFIKDRICLWVQSNGGWQAVLRTGLNVIQQLAIIGTCAAIVSVCLLFAKKHL